MWLLRAAASLLVVTLTLLQAGSAARVPSSGYHTAQFAADPLPLELAVESSTAEQEPDQDRSSGAFGDYYYYQDELTAAEDTAFTGHGFEGPTEQRKTYVLEDTSGRISVVEEESRSLPNVGVISWVRPTAPGSESVTMVSTSSSSDLSTDASSLLDAPADSFGLMQQLTSNVFDGSMGSLFAPLNDLIDAIEAQQQQLLGKMAASAHRHGPRMDHMQQIIGPQYKGPHLQHGSSKPCPMHQAMMAAVASEPLAAASAAATEEQQQQHEQQMDFFDQYIAQQQLHMRQQVQRAHLQSLLEDNGLSLINGVVVALHDNAHIELDSAPGSEFPDLEEVYDEYADDTTHIIFDDRLYDATDDSYLLVGSFEAGDSQDAYSAWSEPNMSWWDALNPVSGMDLDLALLVLLVACTGGMCIAFLQSLLQLREVLQDQPATASSSRVLRISCRRPAALAAIAAGCCCCANRKGSALDGGVAEGLTQPLLEEQQHPTATASGVQSFNNPLYYNPLSCNQHSS